MKICSKCQQEKPLSDFGQKSNGKYQSLCRPCNVLYQQEWYAANREKHIAGARVSHKKNRGILREWMFNYLSDKKCIDCGNNDFRVLQFDHVQGVKFKAVSVMMSEAHSLAKIKAEIDKCVLRCANCHCIKTGSQAGWWWTKT